MFLHATAIRNFLLDIQELIIRTFSQCTCFQVENPYHVSVNASNALSVFRSKALTSEPDFCLKLSITCLSYIVAISLMSQLVGISLAMCAFSVGSSHSFGSEAGVNLCLTVFASLLPLTEESVLKCSALPSICGVNEMSMKLLKDVWTRLDCLCQTGLQRPKFSITGIFNVAERT